MASILSRPQWVKQLTLSIAVEEEGVLKLELKILVEGLDLVDQAETVEDHEAIDRTGWSGKWKQTISGMNL